MAKSNLTRKQKEDSLQTVATAMLTGYNLGKQAAQTA